jgi:radical SAM protein with 4Fe4S-binding SPASM domain
MKLRTDLRPRLTPCSELYFGPMVYWDGKVGGCNCRDVDARELVIGNVKDKHLADIWFGPEIERLREEFTSGKMNPLCRKCSHYSNLSVYLRKDMEPVLNAFKPCEREAPEENLEVADVPGR